MLVKVFGAAVQGIEATLITIEVNCSRDSFPPGGIAGCLREGESRAIVSALR